MCMNEKGVKNFRLKWLDSLLAKKKKALFCLKKIKALNLLVVGDRKLKLSGK